MKGVNKLDIARCLIEEGWCQGGQAKSASGRFVDANSKLAVSWSLAGALLHVGIDIFSQTDTSVAAIRDVIGTKNIFDWNEQEGRTSQEVLDALSWAILSIDNSGRTG